MKNAFEVASGVARSLTTSDDGLGGSIGTERHNSKDSYLKPDFFCSKTTFLGLSRIVFKSKWLTFCFSRSNDYVFALRPK